MDQREIEALVLRVRAVLEKHAGADGPLTGVLGPAKVVREPEKVFYRSGIAEQAAGPVGIASLKLDAESATSRAFLVAVFSSRARLVVATRWEPRDERPVLMRGAGAAARWTAAFER